MTVLDQLSARLLDEARAEMTWSDLTQAIGNASDGDRIRLLNVIKSKNKDATMSLLNDLIQVVLLEKAETEALTYIDAGAVPLNKLERII